MTYAYRGAGALDYFPCRYGMSKLLFRGPRRQLEGDYCAAIGGTETYGKFVAEPWPHLLEKRTGMPVVNFGCLNAGADVFAGEPEVTRAAAASRVTVLQLMGAQNMTNRFYAVHPRRNDRVLRPSSVMRAIFPEVDFAEMNFTRHLLGELEGRFPERFPLLVQELRTTWVSRMRGLIDRIGGRVVLLWLGDAAAPVAGGPPGLSPLLVTAGMVEDILPAASALVRVEPSRAARDAGIDGMHVAPLDVLAAAGMPGPQVHAEIAEALEPALRNLL